ncbi:MAG: prolipoprotein diacylglyceryl transferase [Candidatus Omnitrophica bacterium]|nr:prolipoprotein diacylglyceryl transferase [Candidatus Omnitrophota bacterium]
MHPIICQIGPLTIYSYGLMMAIAVLLCVFLAGRDAAVLGVSREIIYDLAFWTVFAGIIGARIFFVILEWDFFAVHPGEVLMLQKGGLAWQGGLIGGVSTGLIYVRLKRLSVLAMADFAAPYIALGHAIGRIGCFLNGCCYGREVPWGIFFPAHQAHLHPTQLYESVSLFVIFLILKKMRNSFPIPGQTFALYLILASMERLVVEFFRADHLVTYAGLSVFQWMTLAIGAVGMILYAAVTRRGKSRL